MNVLVGIFDTLRDLWRKRDDKYRDDEGDFTFWSVTSEELMKLLENASGMIIGLDALIPAVESLFTGETYYEHKIIAIDAILSPALVNLQKQLRISLADLLTL